MTPPPVRQPNDCKDFSAEGRRTGGGVKIFAHRGASKEAPDNSPEAVRKAIEIGVDGIEIDCLIRKDGVPIAAHDTILPETPTLKEILEIIKTSNAKVILDIKAQQGWMQKGAFVILKQAVALLPPEQILVSSFYFRHLWSAKKNFTHLKRGLILGRPVFKLVPPIIFDKLFGVASVHPGLWSLNKSSVGRWKKQGWKVYTWVANTEEEFKRCHDLDVNGIFTDNPRLAKKFYGR